MYGKARMLMMEDVAWSGFRAALNREMTQREPRLNASLFELRLRDAGVAANEERISNWRRGRARPRLSELRGIVDALNFDRRDGRATPFTLAQLLTEMQILPEVKDEELFGRAYRLHKLNSKLQDAETAIASVGKRAGAARIVQEATTSGDWAVAVTPAVEGPDQNTQMHVGDRLTIVRMRGTPSSPDPKADLWADERMKSAIRSTYALPSGAGHDYRWEHPPLGAAAKPTSWSISYVMSPRDAVVSVPWPGLRALGFVAVTQTSWVKNVASLVSLAIGYGLTTTSDIAMTESGRAIDETTTHARAAAHQFLLDRLPARRAWAHYGTPLPDQRIFADSVGDKSVRFVYLNQSDDSLAMAPLEGSLDELKNAQKSILREAESLPDNVLVLPCNLQESRSHRWGQVFEQAFRVLRWLGSPESGIAFPPDRLAAAHERVKLLEGGVAIPLLNWLDSRDWQRSLDEERRSTASKSDSRLRAPERDVNK